MTTMTITAQSDLGTQVSPIANFFAEFSAGMQDARQIENRYRILSRMTPSELAAIGMTRSDIARVALSPVTR
jgi:hypothetical protein